MRLGRFDFAPTTVAVGGAAIATLLLSLLLAMRQAAGARSSESGRRFSGSAVVQRLPSLLPPARLPAPIPVLVVRDDAAAGYREVPAAQDSIVDRWRDVLAATGADVRVVAPAALAGALRSWRRPGVLVVPDSPCLSIATHEAIARVRREGGGLIITGRAAMNDAACRPIGYGFVVAASGAARVEPVNDRDMVYVTIPSGGPLSLDVPPGARLDLRPSHQLALRVFGRDAYYSDYDLQPHPAHDIPLVDGAITHTIAGRARTVYWGFDLGDAVRVPWTQEILRVLVRNTVAWAAAVPLASVEAWPGSRRAAAAIAQDVEAGFADARAALDTLRAAHVRSTYFVISNLARRNAELSRSFPAAGEIASHTENHRLLGGEPADVQAERLARTQHDLTALLGYSVLGLRPPEEQFDESTMSGWLAAGGSYVFGANDSRSAAPELLQVRGSADPLVLLGRVGGDDFAVLTRTQARSADTVAATFIHEFARFRALGGMYVLSYHSQNLELPAMLGGLARVARRLAADSSVWLATTGEIADWWRRRAALEVRVAGDPSRALSVIVHNRGRRPVAEAVVRLSVPGAGRPLAASAPLLAAAPGTVRLALPTIPAGATRPFTVTWTKIGAASASGGVRHRRFIRRSEPWWKRLFH